MKKRILSIALSIVMLVSLLPTTALAANSNPHTGGHDGWNEWDGNSHITASGNYYLNNPPASSNYIVIGDISKAHITVTLCLNGQTLNLSSYLTITNATVNLCDCSSRQTGKIVGSDASGVYQTIFQDGDDHPTELNMYGGTISGKSLNGAVCVDGSKHTFNMYGGKITNAYSGSTSTGAVRVADGEFNMCGGEISDCSGCSGIYAFGTATITMVDDAEIKNNTSNSRGGGVYISGSDANFTMTGGSITGNTAKNGGGVYVSDGTFTMTGGNITGNTATGTDLSSGGGVYVSSGTFNVSGSPKITGNKKDGNANNVYLPDNGKVITVTGELDGDAQIGVRMSAKTGTFAQPYGATVTDAAPYAEYFKSDNDSYIVQPSGNNLALVVPHTHGSWTFSCSGSDMGYTLTAECGNDGCTLQGNPVRKFDIRTDTQYSPGYKCPVQVASLSGSADWWGEAKLEEPTVRDNGLENGLTGTATITVRVNGVDVKDYTIEYTLVEGTLKAEDFYYTVPGSLTYDGSAKEAGFTANNNVADKIGDITVEYYLKGTDEAVEPINAGKYTVKIDVAASTYYNAASIEDNDWYFEISPKNISGNDITIEAIPAQTYTGREIKPKPVIEFKGEPLKEGVDYEIRKYENNVEVGTASVTVKGIGNFTGITAPANFSIVYPTKDASEVFTWTTGANGWFNVENAPVFTPTGGYEVSTEANGTYGTGALDFYNNGEGEVTQTVYVKEIETDTIYQVTLTYNYDRSYPEVTAEEVDDTWSSVSKDIMVTATDDISGVASVEISDYLGVKQDVELVAGSYFCTVTEIGTYAVTVTDNAGNVSERVVYVKHIDKSVPWLIKYGYNFDGGWHTSAPTVTVEGHDEESGIPAEGAYSFDGGATWQSVGTKEYRDGEHTVTIWVKDNVGNIQQCDPFTVKVDTVAPGAPVVTATVGGESYSGEWTTGDVVFTLFAADATSGIQKYQYRLGEGEWEDIDGNTYTHTVSTDENGVVYQFRAVDNAGNVGAESGGVVVKKRHPYTISWDTDGDGTVDDTTTVNHGDTPNHAAGSKAADARYTYIFTDWYPTISAATENVTYTAQFSSTVNKYIVKFVNKDGTVLQSSEVAYGEVPVYNCETPTKAATAQYTYTFAGWTPEIAVVTGEVTYTATYDSTVNQYAVTFNANGGIADTSVNVNYGDKVTKPADPTKDGSIFAGWYTADEGGVQYDFNDPITGNVILYAQWSAEPVYGIAGRVDYEVEGEGASGWAAGATVQLKQGNTVLFTKITDDYGRYEFHAPAGTYNIVVEKDGKTMTRLIAVIDHDESVETIHLPYQNVSSELTVSVGTPDIVVGGLDEEVVESNPNATAAEIHITLAMTVEQKEDVTSSEAPEDVELKAEQEEIKDEAGSQSENLTFFTIDLSKITTTNQVSDEPEEVTTTANLLEIIIPFETSGRQSFKVYRYHGGDVDVLTTTANVDGEYIEVGNGTITIHAKKFSTYAIGYTEPAPYYPPVVSVHACTSKCEICDGCKDAKCNQSACKDKCLLLGMSFTDVADGKWYTEAVEYVYHHKMMEGVGNNLFDINGTTTRAMIVTILWRMEGEPVVNYLMQFDDIPADTWYTEAVRWAASEKIVEGYGDTFGPNDPITREQFATILWRYAKYKGYDVSVGEDTNILSYEDAFSVSEYAIPAMQWACGAGLMQGDGVNLTPKSDATRAQAAALFQRFCENVAEK